MRPKTIKLSLRTDQIECLRDVLQSAGAIITADMESRLDSAIRRLAGKLARRRIEEILALLPQTEETP